MDEKDSVLNRKGQRLRYDKGPHGLKSRQNLVDGQGRNIRVEIIYAENEDYAAIINADTGRTIKELIAKNRRLNFEKKESVNKHQMIKIKVKKELGAMGVLLMKEVRKKSIDNTDE